MKRTSPYLEQPLALSAVVSGSRGLRSVSLCQSHLPSDWLAGAQPGAEGRCSEVVRADAVGVEGNVQGLIRTHLSEAPTGGLPARSLPVYTYSKIGCHAFRKWPGSPGSICCISHPIFIKKCNRACVSIIQSESSQTLFHNRVL